MRERAVHEQAQRGADRVEHRAVRLGQRADEPEEADDRHQHADPVLRPAHDRDETAADEDQPEADDERSARGRVVLVVAREDERERGSRRCQGDRPRGDQKALRHASSVVSTAPDNSAFGTKPRAPHSSTHEP